MLVVGDTGGDRAQATAQAVAMTARMSGTTFRTAPRPLPPQQYPWLIEGEYERELVGVVNHLEQELQPLLGELPGLLRAAAAERTDANEASRIRALLEQARARHDAWLNDARIKGASQKFADRASFFQRNQLARQLRAALGVDVQMLDKKLRSRIEGFVEESLLQVRDLSAGVLGGIERVIMRGLSTGQSWEEMGKEIAKRFDVGRSRARSIARDQISRLVGRLNADRQQELGINEYIWRTRKDELVRPEHRKREGKRYAWSWPGAAPYIPGEEWNCRCYAEPVMEGVLTHLAAIKKMTVAPRRTKPAVTRKPVAPRAAPLPTWASLGREGKIVTIMPQRLFEAGLDLSAIRGDLTRIERVKSGLLEGREELMGTPEVVMTRDGRITEVVDGRHRIVASYQLDRPIRVRISRAFEPAAASR